MHLAIWIVSLLFLGLWSLAAWGLHALLGVDPTWVGDLKPLVERIPFGPLLEQWVPGWQALLLALIDLTQVLLGWAGSVAPWVVVVVWGLGALLLLGMAALASLVVALLRRTSQPSPPAPGQPA